MGDNFTCPECDEKCLPIQYGLPSGSMFKKAERGKVWLGGCMIWPDNPKWHCPECDREFTADGNVAKED